MEPLFDVAIIGGGINGCGCAADAALRGLSVFLCEQDDLASKTSSSSTKLIHGGLRYLEHYNFSMVKKALDERQTLMNLAPHIVRPLPLVIPHQHTIRSRYRLRAGFFLYDHLSKKNLLPKSRIAQRYDQPQYFDPLLSSLNEGFLFYDCTTDDARLTLANALLAKEYGAVIKPRTRLIEVSVQHNQWILTLETKQRSTFQIHAKSIINAAGPWIESINNMLGIPMQYPLTLVKGSHIVVPKLYEGEHAYFLQHKDMRVIFVIPFHGLTMIGTTEVTINNISEKIAIETHEAEYLCSLVNQYFKKNITPEHILHSWSGVRPLLNKTEKTSQAISRDYGFHYIQQPAVAITIYGGKITTYRKLAVQTINQLRSIKPTLSVSKTMQTYLPGAQCGTMTFDEYTIWARKKYHWLDPHIREHYLQTYGTRTELFLSECKKMEDLGQHFSPILYQIEVDYLVREEWAVSCEDILWRRTKLGLTTNAQSQKTLAEYLTQYDSH